MHKCICKFICYRPLQGVIVWESNAAADLTSLKLQFTSSSFSFYNEPLWGQKFPDCPAVSDWTVVLSGWNASQLTLQLIQQLCLDKVYFSGTEMFPHIHHKILPFSTVGVLFFHEAWWNRNSNSNKIHHFSEWHKGNNRVIFYQLLLAQDRLNVRLWGCQSHYSAHIKYCVWVYALHRNTYPTALWIAVTKKMSF